MQIRIYGYQFNLSAPYQPGQAIDPAEAQVLNNIRAENIQNILRKAVQQKTAELLPGQLLSPTSLAELQATVDKFDAGYRFQMRQPQSRIGEIEVETQAVAAERAEIHFREQGAEPTEGELAEMTSRFAAMPSVSDEARARIAARRAVTAGALEDLL